MLSRDLRQFDLIESSDGGLKHLGLSLVECRRSMFDGFRRFNRVLKKVSTLSG